MTHKTFNADTSRAKDSRRKDSNGSIVSSDRNGQAAVFVRSNAVSTKKEFFSLRVSDGAVIIKKTQK